MKNIETPDQLKKLLLAGSPVAVNISGGKDSIAMSFAVDAFLREIGYTGPKLLIHSDLGLIEHQDSIVVCRELATRLGWEFVVVRRKAGGMIEQFNQRWDSICARYYDLEIVSLMLPWATAMWRFCTKGQKTEPIQAYLTKRFPGTTIVSAIGIRAEESRRRAQSRVFEAVPKMTKKRSGTLGYDWKPILQWQIQDVLSLHSEVGFRLHRFYTDFGAERVSCCFCVLASDNDINAAYRNPENREAWRGLVALEIASGYSFRTNKWLADVGAMDEGPVFLARVAAAKALAQRRTEIEARIPEHLFFEDRFPVCLPSLGEANILAQVRSDVAALYGWQLKYTTGAAIRERYAELLHEKELKRSA